MIAIAFATIRLIAWMVDHDDEIVWAMAIDPQNLEAPWESLVANSVSSEQICGLSYLSNIWPAPIVNALEEGTMFDRGVVYRGEEQITIALKDAEKYWRRKRWFTVIPAIRQRLERQLGAFRKVATIAKTNHLILLIIVGGR
jgi:hypothetical protein